MNPLERLQRENELLQRENELLQRCQRLQHESSQIQQRCQRLQRENELLQQQYQIFIRDNIIINPNNMDRLHQYIALQFKNNKNIKADEIKNNLQNIEPNIKLKKIQTILNNCFDKMGICMKEKDPNDLRKKVYRPYQ